MNPTNKGTLGNLPPNLWCKVTKYLKPQDIVALKTTSRDVSAELDGIHTKIPADKWDKKLKKMHELMEELKACNITLAQLCSEIRRGKSLRKEDADMVEAYLNAYAALAKQVKEKISKLKLRKLLDEKQQKELDEVVLKMKEADSRHQSQQNKLLTEMAQITKQMVGKI